MSTNNWSTTGLDSVSQLSASNNGLIRRSRSSTIRFCCGYVHVSSRANARKEREDTYGHGLLQMHQLFRQHLEYRQRRLWNMRPIARRYTKNPSVPRGSQTPTVTYGISAGEDREGEPAHVWVQVQVGRSDRPEEVHVAAVAAHPTHVGPEAGLSPASEVPG